MKSQVYLFCRMVHTFLLKKQLLSTPQQFTGWRVGGSRRSLSHLFHTSMTPNCWFSHWRDSRKPTGLCCQSWIACKFRSFINVFRRRATCFYRRAELYELNFFIIMKNFPLNSQASWPKLSSQPVNLPNVGNFKHFNLILTLLCFDQSNGRLNHRNNYYCC